MDLNQIWDTLQNIGNQTLRMLPRLVFAVIIFLIFLFLAKAIRKIVNNLTEKRGKARNLGVVLGRLSQGAMVIGGLLIALLILFPSFRPVDLIQLLGISSVAIGFAFRDILQNFLAGLILLVTNQFKINDQIKTGEYEGTVEDIQTRATILKTYDGRRVVIPNGTLLTSSVIINTAFDKRRLEYDVGIGYGDDIDKAKQLILQAVGKVNDVLQDPAPEVLVMELADFSVNIRVRWWINPPRQLDALDSRDKVLAAIKQKLLANGIDLPFPTQHVLFHDQTEETDGDRSQQREGWPAGKGEVPKPRSIARAIQRGMSRSGNNQSPMRDEANGKVGRAF